ncbi:MAG: glutaminyl-peptide cyclotransferase [Ignavibacteria bacterium]|jgi:glutamine cyclotransferase
MVTNLHRLGIISILCAILWGCSETEKPTGELQSTSTPKREQVDQLSFTIVRRLPHSQEAFTQGLEVYNGAFLESTGQYGSSTIRQVDIPTGKVLKSRAIDKSFFGEGLTELNSTVYMLTWLNQQGLIFDASTLRQTGTFRYSGEGWGITNDGKHLYISNGTSVISVLDPTSWTIVRTIPITLDGMAVSQLNELEWIDGAIWANVWQSDRVIRISPTTGNVTGVLDLTGILPQNERTPTTDVLNGLAWNPSSKTLFVTGKNWPAVFELSIR